MNLRHFLFSLLAVGVVSLGSTGCGRPAADSAHAEHAAETEGEAAAGVAFREGHGLNLSSEVVSALGLVTAEAEDRVLSTVGSVTARVYATRPQVRASARLPAAQAAGLDSARFTGATLVQVDRSAVAATSLVDLVFALEAVGPREVGDFVPLAFVRDSASALSVPVSALLDGAAGPFVYVANGDAYLRTPVQIGARSADFVEITDGLYAGDVVVVTAVEQLWLTELRLTKGGGHSH